MAPRVTLHLIRHAQGYHNLGVEFHSLLDPRLTPLGQSQCQDLQSASFPPATQSRISLIAASPLTRTLHTAYLTFQPLLNPAHPEHAAAANGSKLVSPRIIALPDAQETSDYPCDTGSAPTKLADFLAEQKWPVDIDLLTPSWTEKGLGTRYSPYSEAILARARDARVWLREKAVEVLKQQKNNDQEDVELVLVTHGGYLHYFTGDWEGTSQGLGTGWRNCETRAYEFEAGASGDDREAKIVETTESRERRGQQGPRKTWVEQEGLMEEAMQGWENAGLQRPDRIGVEGVDWKSGLDVQVRKDTEQQVEGKEEMGPGLRLVESQDMPQDMPVASEEDVAQGLRRERRESVTIRARA